MKYLAKMMKLADLDEVQLFFYTSQTSKVKLATLVEGNPNVPFLIATTPGCWEECYLFLWIIPL